ncbi:uncharacterized protein [Gorilla gorilla gorilla]|uniref:uncharacterized protein n=1 Tax=Gorilla gorilla gorilla TaxID=9595 RepID=UPI0024462DCE|nr:uncharacterized protein LOC129524023 [Gorilla gorilla gorilla]
MLQGRTEDSFWTALPQYHSHPDVGPNRNLSYTRLKKRGERPEVTHERERKNRGPAPVAVETEPSACVPDASQLRLTTPRARPRGPEAQGGDQKPRACDDVAAGHAKGRRGNLGPAFCTFGYLAQKYVFNPRRVPGIVEGDTYQDETTLLRPKHTKPGMHKGRLMFEIRTVSRTFYNNHTRNSSCKEDSDQTEHQCEQDKYKWLEIS